MTKYLRVTMPDGTKWDVPAQVIAENRAKYYVENDHSANFDEEFKFTMSDDYELADWAANNMNWSDVERVAKIAIKTKADMQEGWINGDKEVVEY